MTERPSNENQRSAQGARLSEALRFIVTGGVCFAVEFVCLVLLRDTLGLDTLAAALGEDAGTLEEVYEPYLIQHGLIQRTPRGRIATQKAYRHLGIPFQEQPDGNH